MHRSIDGGRTFTRIRVPHGDTHIMWVDPNNPDRLINGNDGGATVSLDGGRTWSSQDNQPTSQFYHVITDHQVPYRIYGAQQDNTTVSIASRSDNGAIGERDWLPVAGCENAYIAIDPRNTDITYGGCYMGALYAARQAHEDHARRVRVAAQLRRHGRDRRAAALPVDLPRALLAARLRRRCTSRRSTCGARAPKAPRGRSSRPTSRCADPATLGRSGGPVTGDMTGTEWYATIFAFAESPVRAGVLWAGSDDGLRAPVHRQRRHLDAT